MSTQMEVEVEGVEVVTTAEIIRLGATDGNFFNKTFFAKTVRQDSPNFHNEIQTDLDSHHRFINIQVFRDGAKTSLLRMYAAKRIAYGISRTILYIGKSEGHAVRSVRWLRRQIEFNRRFTQTFQLSPGKKWQDTECEIVHGLASDGEPKVSWILGAGITGSIRGINFDDYRPDLIIVDDVVDEENAATPEQRHKINNLMYGAVKQSLAPASESPLAKLVALQTPLNKEDYSTMALEDPEWMSKKYGCWTEETKNLPLDQQESSWPQRYPSDVVRNEKRAAIKRNQLSIFLREKECKLVSPETATFKEDWLRYYDVLPEHMSTVLAIDPVPPPSPQQVASGMANKDYEVLLVMGASGPDYYLLDVIAHRGHVPSWTITQFFQMAEKWRPGKVRVEGTQYQRTLSWLLKNAMEERRQYYVIDDLADNRNKVTRITDSYSGPCSNGHFYVKKEHTEFIAQFIEYPDVSHDDILDAGAMAITALTGMGQTIDSLNSIMKEEEEIDDLVYSRGAP